jgi:SUZ domain
MPQLVVTSTRTGSISPGVVPPASAFQSPIRILKRSTAPAPTGPTQKKGDGGDASDSSSPSSPASAAPMSAGTFAERSARYNAARERIFAAGATEASSSAGPGMGSSSTGEGGVTGGAGAGAVSAIIRNPKGPEPVQGPNAQGRGGSQGFGMRTGKRGSSGHQPNDD